MPSGAPRLSRRRTGTAAVLTQDVSYLADRPGHGSATLPPRHGSPRHFVDYQIPPTQIPEADHVRVAAPLMEECRRAEAKLHTAGAAGAAWATGRRSERRGRCANGGLSQGDAK